ncbi:hypothetical protein G9A89_001389 [Geosiphon pyriformis]|nr:hypothetical protein G9A89_001389 [Geosiphon pyriformis]
MGSFNNQIPFKIITAIFMASVFYFLMHESYSSWITSKVIQKDKKLDINYNSPTMINWIDQIHIPLNINQTKKRSQSQSESQMKRRILPDDGELKFSSDFAFIVNAFDCLGLNNVGSRVPGLKIKVPLTFKDDLKFPKETRVDSQLLKEVDLLFPILLEGIKSSLSKFSKLSQKFDIVFTGHGLGGAYACLAAVRWAIERYKIINNNTWRDINLSRIGQVIYTYGAPRVGNVQLSETFNLAIAYRRFTHGNDHVPHYPSTLKGWKHFGNEIWIEPLSNCDCAAEDDPNTYWDCNFSYLALKERELWTASEYTEENLGCNAGQSINKVPGNLFHNGPYFGIEMGNCESISKVGSFEEAMKNFQNRNND